MHASERIQGVLIHLKEFCGCSKQAMHATVEELVATVISVRKEYSATPKRDRFDFIGNAVNIFLENRS